MVNLRPVSSGIDRTIHVVGMGVVWPFGGAPSALALLQQVCSTDLFGIPRHLRSQCFAWVLGSFLYGTLMVAYPCFCYVARSLCLSSRFVSLSSDWFAAVVAWLPLPKWSSQWVCINCGQTPHPGSLSCGKWPLWWLFSVAFSIACSSSAHSSFPLLEFCCGLWGICGTSILPVLLYSSGVLASSWGFWMVHGVLVVGYGSVAGTNFLALKYS